MRTSLAALLLVGLSCSHPQQTPASRPAEDRGWIERSNQNAQLLLQVQAQFQPELAARQGIPGLDDRISDTGTDCDQLVTPVTFAGSSRPFVTCL